MLHVSKLVLPLTYTNKQTKTTTMKNFTIKFETSCQITYQCESKEKAIEIFKQNFKCDYSSIEEVA